MVVGIAGIGLLQPAMPFWLLCIALLAVGAARSIAFTGMMALTFADVEQDELAGATVLNNLANALSAALGVSLASLLVNLAVGEGGGAGSLADYRLAILCLAVVGALAIPLFARLPRDAGAAVSGHRLSTEPG
eukprot:gene50625-68866_t